MPNYYRTVAHRLSPHQRQMLVDHAGLTVLRATAGSRATRDVLFRLKMIYSCTLRGYHAPPRRSPVATRLTELGRAVVAVLLAEQAEALVAAGCDDASPVTLAPEMPAEARAEAEPTLTVP
ncbi:MAG: hypothetical protein KGL39_49770 [Patescibacteria group bacterium]|nr:hypothetical protein [Patescibacteria group bacterium]